MTGDKPFEGHKVQLSVQLDESEFGTALEAAFRKIAQEVRIPAFRGEAPSAMVEAHYVVHGAKQEAVMDALLESDMAPITQHDLAPDTVAPKDTAEPGQHPGSGPVKLRNRYGLRRLHLGRDVRAVVREADDGELVLLRIDVRTAGEYRSLSAPNRDLREEEPPGHTPAAVGPLRGETDRRDAQLNLLVHQLSPEFDIPTPTEVLQARRNASARASLLTEFGALTSSQVADLVGSEAKNRSSLAHRWRKEGRLLGVQYKGTVWYPGFQFHDGDVLPVVVDVLAELGGAGAGEWEIALWFTAPSGWLADRRPVDLLLSDPLRVIEAARREVAEFGT